MTETERERRDGDGDKLSSSLAKNVPQVQDFSVCFCRALELQGECRET